MYDVKCFDLARLFLTDHENIDCTKNVRQLAQVIQDAIETEIEEMERVVTNTEAAIDIALKDGGSNE